MLLKGSKNYPLGLDISDRILKMVQLKKTRDKVKLQGLGKYRLHKGVIDDGIIKDQSSFAKAVRALMNNPIFGGFSSNEVIACLPDSKTYIKLIEVPASPNRLNDVVRTEIEKYIPLPTKEIYFDWQLIGSTGNEHQILIAASPRQLADSYIEALSAAKLSVVGLELESLSLCRALLAEENSTYQGQYNNNYCLIDIGATHTSLTIYSKNTIILSVSLPISSDEVTKKIAGALEIKLSQAEKAKIICGLDKSQAQGIVYNILSKMVNHLVDRLTETLNFYSDHFSDRGPISQIIVCGGGARIKNLEQIIGNATGIVTVIGNSIRHLSEPPSLNRKTLSSMIPTKPDENINSFLFINYTTALGLAMRNIFINQY